MNAEIQNAYESASAMLRKLKEANKQYVRALEEKGEAEINLDSITSLVTRELDNGGVSKTALPQLVKGDKRVLDARAELIRADVKCKTKTALVKFVEKEHDLEKKRMQAEMDEANRLNLKE
jgi:hypothetical protein